MTKAAIYCRVSTFEQTVEQQVYACSKWCEVNGYEPQVFAEEGVSGRNFMTSISILKKRGSTPPGGMFT